MVDFDWIKKPVGIIYLIAWILSIVLLAIWYSHDGSLGSILYLTIASTFFVLFYFLMSYVVGEAQADEFSIVGMVFLILHGILNLVCGAVLLVRENYRDEVKLIVTAIIAIVLCILLFVNAYFIFKNR